MEREKMKGERIEGTVEAKGEWYMVNRLNRRSYG